MCMELQDTVFGIACISLGIWVGIEISKNRTHDWLEWLFQHSIIFLLMSTGIINSLLAALPEYQIGNVYFTLIWISRIILIALGIIQVLKSRRNRFRKHNLGL